MLPASSKDDVRSPSSLRSMYVLWTVSLLWVNQGEEHHPRPGCRQSDRRGARAKPSALKPGSNADVWDEGRYGILYEL